VTTKEQLTDHIWSFVTDNKKAIFNKVIEERMRHIAVVLEDIYQPQNASAVLRSCDCFGIQDLHVIESRNTYKVNPKIVMGASKWVDVHHHPTTTSCIDDLKNQGYQIVATTPHTNDVDIYEFNPAKKSAIVFGTEMQGLSDEVLEKADVFVKIPMYGFTESFNISVAAALCLNQITHNLRQSEIDWQLNDEEKQDLKLRWGKSCVRNADIVEKEFLKTLENNNV
jgi:tRNA (guanosine-2'-O-)-methyltransferase